MAVWSEHLLSTASLILLLLFTTARFTLASRHNRLPPGPKGWPIIGNLLQMPKGHNWVTFAAWAKIYGDVVYIRIFSREIVILNSYNAVHDLMISRSSLYSERPQRIMSELSGYSESIFFLNTGERWRKLRRLLRDGIGGHHSIKYHPLQEAEARTYLLQLHNKPACFREHVRRFAGAVILRITYGYSVAMENDPLIVLAEDVTKNASMIFTHGAFIIEALPFLKHFPTWTPVLGRFRRKALQWKNTLENFMDIPHVFVKDNLAHGLAAESFTSHWLQHGDEHVTPEEEELIKMAAASLYGGGADTTVSIATSFFLAMTLNPDVQRKAQDEIDSIVGTERLPSLKDRPFLPYMECLVKECLRWNPVAPLVTHCTQKEDTYRGFHIPPGTLIVANVWSITHDEAVYSEPMRFDPDRFCTDTTNIEESSEKRKNPRTSVFGFGKRICPGQALADDSLWILIATTLATFTIHRSRDAEGVVFEPEVRYTSHSLCHPEQFPCEVSPRSTEALSLLRGLT